MIEGRHVKLVGRVMTGDKLGSVAAVTDLVKEIVRSCEMRLLDKVHVYDVALEIEKLKADKFEDEGGVTAVGVLSTSRCAIHTWPLRGLFVMDVYSCRDFNALQVGASVRSSFDDDARSLELKLTDVSFALEMPDEWRHALPSPSSEA